MRRTFLWLLKNTLNRLTTRVARSGRGPFSLVRHVRRKSGIVYETPIIVAAAPEGFVAELTYGEDVNWYRNIVAAGGCDLLAAGATPSCRRGRAVPDRRGQARLRLPRAARADHASPHGVPAAPHR
jgi:hypothetical protein